MDFAFDPPSHYHSSTIKGVVQSSVIMFGQNIKGQVSLDQNLWHIHQDEPSFQQPPQVFGCSGRRQVPTYAVSTFKIFSSSLGME